MSENENKTISNSFFELVEFTLERHLEDGSIVKGFYGVSVDKVREVIKMPKINKLTTKLRGIEGIFELRGVPIPAINLGLIFGDAVSPIKPTDQIVIAEFEKRRAGFIVNSTQRIKRILSKEIMPAAADAGSCISGMTLIKNEEFLFIVDIERVIKKIEKISSLSA